MGGDGGVIATQRAFARGVGKNEDRSREAKNVHLDQTSRAANCALTNEPLKEPIVICELGHLYNKEAILGCLLEKTLPEDLHHIRGLKDLKTLTFARIVSSSSCSSSASSSAAASHSNAKFVCPVTKDEFNGLQPFVAVWSTGYVLSEKAIREVGLEGLQEEYGPFTTDDLIKINPLEGDMDTIRAQMHRRRELRAATGKGNRKRKSEEAVEDPSSASNSKKSISNNCRYHFNRIPRSSSSKDIKKWSCRQCSLTECRRTHQTQ